MISFPHTVRKQSLELAVGSERLAFSLQPRLADWNRRRLLPAIEQVLDEMAVPGLQIHIDRLEIDLGTVPLADLEEEGEQRLRRELRRALEKALRGLAEGSSADGRWRSEEVARRELLEHLLLHGTSPFWVPRRPELSLESLVLEMAQDEPESLAEAVRALGHRGRVLERLVAQLRETTLARLVGLLEPLHAALILDYLGHLRAVHRDEPLLPLSDRALGESLWLLVLTYLVRDPGSQFNRKSFVRSLLQGLADARGFAYAAILATLRLGLERMARRHSVRSSLPAVVAELIAEQGLAGAASEAAGARSGLRQALAAGRAAGARQLLRLVRDAPELRQEVVRDCPAPLFERMLGQLLPAEDGVLRALLQALAAIPSPYRPRPESLIHEVVFDQAVLLGRGQPLGEGFFTRVLRDLFTWPLAEPVRRTLLEQAAAWAGFGRLPESRVAAFRAAVEVAAGDAAGGAAPVPRHLADHELREALQALLGDPAEEAGLSLRRQLADRRTRRRWVRVLSEDALVRLAGLLEPRRHRALLAAAEVLAAAWRETAPPDHAYHPALTGRRAFWDFLLDLLSRPAAERSVERLVTAFFAHSAARTLAVAPAEPGGAAEEGARLLAAADRLAREGGHAGLLTALQRDRRTLLAPWQPAARRPRRPRRPTSKRPAQGRTAGDEEATADAVYVDNAGLVLAAPFLPPLFQTLDMLEQGEDGRIRLRDEEAASRAVHLLQFLVDGRTDAPEPLLVLNKILCGVPLGAPVLRAIEITEPEREVCDKLLRSLLAGWTAIANTSVAGLRETFLQREGKLQRGDEGWTLRVQRKTVDVLVDDLPWSLSVVLHRWMAQPLHVRW